MSSERYGVIVDGYSTGAGLAKEFYKYNIRCLHVQSQKDIPAVYKHTFKLTDYEENFIFDGSLDSILKQLKAYLLDFIIVGAECGIELADQLSEKLNLPTNGVELSSCRRDKYLMMEQVAKLGLQAIPSFFATKSQEILTWAAEQSYWPLIIKPVNSAGGEDVKICRTLEEVEAAYFSIMEKPLNMLGFENKGVLIQHYITGKEYVINTVSYDGHHKICEIWEYTRYLRHGGYQIYDTAEIVAYEPEQHDRILEYSVRVLDALGIKYGPAHVEILANIDGCYLVELGARLMGANLPFELLATSVSTAQASMTVLAYAAPNAFLEKIQSPYTVLKPLMAIFMVSDIVGTVNKINHLDEVSDLSSFFSMNLAVKIGQKISETVDYQTSPGMIYLSNQSRTIMCSDKVRIRQLEKTMFEVESTNI